MSSEDKFAIIGKLYSEIGEARRQSAFIREELEAVVKAFDALLESLRPRAKGTTGGKIDMQPYATKYSDFSKPLALVQEQDQVARQTEELRSRLAELVP